MPDTSDEKRTAGCDAVPEVDAEGYLFCKVCGVDERDPSTWPPEVTASLERAKADFAAGRVTDFWPIRWRMVRGSITPPADKRPEITLTCRKDGCHARFAVCIGGEPVRCHCGRLYRLGLRLEVASEK